MAKLVKEKIKKPYIQRNVLVSKSNIKKYVRPEWHREFRRKHVIKIKNALLRGEHPSENVTVNYLSNANKFRVLNGNHRMQAVREVIEEYSDFKIELTFTIYTDLVRDEEIVIYERVNNTKKESGLDRLKAHLVGTEIYKLMMDRFPFKPLFRSQSTTDRNSLSVGTILASYVVRNDKTIAAGNAQIIKRAVELNEDDYDRIVKFARFFKRICGEPSRSNLYSSYNIYSSIAKIYYTTVGIELTEEEYEKRLRQVLQRNTSDLMLYNSGVHKQKQLYEFLLSRIKRRRRLFNVYEH